MIAWVHAGGYELLKVKKETPKWQKYFPVYSFFLFQKTFSYPRPDKWVFVRGTKMFFRWKVFLIVLVLYSVDK